MRFIAPNRISRLAPRIVHPNKRPMSVRPSDSQQGVIGETRKKVTIHSLIDRHLARTPITMLTAYDYPSALACSAYGVDITLVGDSLAQVCLGYTSTTQLTLQEMIHHARAVARGTTASLLVADMPFGSYHACPEDAVRNAVRLVQEGNVEGVKIEGGQEVAECIRRLTAVGIPVMGHVGLLPQRHTSLSGYKIQGKDGISAQRILRDALAIQSAGAFSIVLEAIPHQLGTYITNRLSIPTIGIGAGPGTSGQVLVWDDVLGTWSGHQAKFVRRFADVRSEREKGVRGYIEAVRKGEFPAVDTESYSMDPGEWEKLLEGEREAGNIDRKSTNIPRT